MHFPSDGFPFMQDDQAPTSRPSTKTIKDTAEDLHRERLSDGIKDMER